MRFQLYDPIYEDQFVSLLDQNFGIHAQDKHALVQWKFFSSPTNRQPIISCGIDEEKNILVGQYNNAPLDLVRGGQTIPAWVCMDMCIDEAYRGQGLIKKIAAYCYENLPIHTCTMGFSNTAGVEVDKKSGYTHIGQTSSVIMPSIGFGSSYTFRSEDTVRERAAQTPASSVFDLRQIPKTPRYISWRYFQRPGGKYRLYSLWDGEEYQGRVVIIESQWYIQVLDVSIMPGSNAASHRAAWQSLARHLSKPFVRIQVLRNKYWKDLFAGSLYYRWTNDRHHHVTCKIHDQHLFAGKMTPDHWYIIGGDIL